MAANVQFIDRVTGEPTPLAQVDEVICERFRVEVHPVNYVFGWYDAVGLLLALDKRGMDLRDQIRTGFGDCAAHCDQLLEVSKFLEDRYRINSWTTVGKF